MVTEAAFNGVLRELEARQLTPERFPGPILVGIIAWPELSQSEQIRRFDRIQRHARAGSNEMRCYDKGDRESDDRDRCCPSAQADMEQAVAFGVVGGAPGNPRVSYVVEGARVCSRTGANTAPQSRPSRAPVAP